MWSMSCSWRRSREDNYSYRFNHKEWPMEVVVRWYPFTSPRGAVVQDLSIGGQPIEMTPRRAARPPVDAWDELVDVASACYKPTPRV